MHESIKPHPKTMKKYPLFSNLSNANMLNLDWRLVGRIVSSLFPLQEYGDTFGDSKFLVSAFRFLICGTFRLSPEHFLCQRSFFLVARVKIPPDVLAGFPGKTVFLLSSSFLAATLAPPLALPDSFSPLV